MRVCRICGRECVNNTGLVSHLQKHNISSKEYYDRYLRKKDEGICPSCGKETTYYNIGYGYIVYCRKCREERAIKNKKKERPKTIKCEFCGEHFQILTAAHLKKHGLTFDDYFSMFGKVETVSEELKKDRNKAASWLRVPRNVEVRCSVCDTVFNITEKDFKWLKEKRGGFYCSKECGYEAVSRQKKINNPMYNRDTVEKVKKTQTEMGYYKKFVERNKERIKREKELGVYVPLMLALKQKNLQRYKEICSETSRRMTENNPMKDPIAAKKMGNTMKEMWKNGEIIFTDEHRKIVSEVTSKRMTENNPMKDPEICRKTISKIYSITGGNKQNGWEKWFEKFCQEKSLPYKFVGDLSFYLGTKCPDFINKEKKRIIEVTREFGRSVETYGKPRIKYFENYGWKTLIICLERVLGNKEKEEEMESIIREFENGGKSRCWNLRETLAENV